MTPGEVENTILAVQYGLPRDQDLSIYSTDQPAAKMSVSQIETFRDFIMTFGDREAITDAMQPVMMAALPSIFSGMINHMLMKVGRTYYHMNRQGKLGRSLPLSAYWAWESPPQRQVSEYITQKILPLQDMQNPSIRTLQHLKAWMGYQDWTYHHNRDVLENPIYGDGIREAVWKGETVRRHYEKVLQNIDLVEPDSSLSLDDPYKSDHLYETPRCIEIKTSQGKLIVWAQPDEVIVVDGKVHVRDYKFKQKVEVPSSIDIFSWIQIILYSAAGQLNAEQFLMNRRQKKPLNDPRTQKSIQIRVQL
jgi:hypothetical protein